MTARPSSPPSSLAEVDLTDLATFADGFPHDVFAVHRREHPVWWHEPTVHTPDDEGFWSVATYAEVKQAPSSSAVGRSVPGFTVVEPVEWARSNRHTGMRSLVVAFEVPTSA